MKESQTRYSSTLPHILKKFKFSIQECKFINQFFFYRVQPGRFLTIQSLNGSGSIGEQLSLPLSPFYLHTGFFRLHSGFQLQPEDKKFASIAWEILNIIKENFPSKIHLHQENLDQCKPFYIPLTQAEELRRQISCLMSVKEEDRPLTHDELEDAWHTLEFSEKIQDVRSMNICLELISQYALSTSLPSFKSEIETLRRIIERNDMTQLNSNRILAQEIMDRILQAQANQMQINDTLQRPLADCGEDTLSLMSENQGYGTTQNTIEKPSSTRMCLFQLSESNDINRVTIILETLAQRSKETLGQMRKKHQLNTKIIQVLKKYCNGDYGFDQISSRHGTFQYNLLKLMIILSSEYVAFLEYLQNSALDYLSQIIEEGIIFAYEDALSGISSMISTNHQVNQNLYKFLRLSLEFLELTIGRQFQEFIPSIRENLRKVQQRMIKLLQKKENVLLNYFIQQFSSEGVPLTNSQLPIALEINLTQQIAEFSQNFEGTNSQQQMGFFGLNVDQISELKAISVGLYEFSVELNFRLQRIEALNDFSEQHEDKHLRLFYKIISHQRTQKDIGGFKNERFSHNDKQNEFDNFSQKKVPTTKGVQFIDIQEESIQAANIKPQQYHSTKDASELNKQQKFTNPQNFQYNLQNAYQTENNQNLITKNKDSSEANFFKRQQQNTINPIGPENKRNIDRFDKENKPHFISSPIKPLQKEINQLYSREAYQK